MTGRTAGAPPLLIISDFSDASGGAEKVATSCIHAAAAANFKVHALYGDSGPAAGALPPEVAVTALGHSALRDRVRPPDLFQKTVNRPATQALSALLRRLGPRAVVHVHTWSQILSPAIFHTLKAAGARVIVTAHDFFLSCPNGGYVNYRSGRICDLKPLSRGCLATNCDKRNYLQKLWRSQRTAVQYRAGDAFWNNVLVILAHRDMEGPLRRNSRLKRFIELRSPTPPFFTEPIEVAGNREIAFLGRMTWEKGVLTLAQALEASERSGVFIGNGPLIDRVRASAPRSEVLGWLDDADAAQRLKRARAFVLPSLMPEPYGLTAVEAMLSGLPVIVSDACLIAREVEAAGAGVAFKSGDAADLARAMARLDDDAAARRMSAAALKLGAAMAPSKEAWARRLTSIYASVAEGTPLDALSPARPGMAG